MSVQFMRLGKRAILGLTIALFVPSGQFASAQVWPDIREAKAIAEEAFI